MHRAFFFFKKKIFFLKNIVLIGFSNHETDSLNLYLVKGVNIMGIRLFPFLYLCILTCMHDYLQISCLTLVYIGSN